MTKPERESWAQVRQEQKIKCRSAVKVIAAFSVVAAAALLGAAPLPRFARKAWTTISTRSHHREELRFPISGDMRTGL